MSTTTLTVTAMTTTTMEGLGWFAGRWTHGRSATRTDSKSETITTDNDDDKEKAGTHKNELPHH